MENKGEILKTFGDEIRSLKDNEYHAIMHNPSAIKQGDPIEKGERNIASAEETMKKLWNQ